MEWPGRSVRAAKLWLSTIAGQPGCLSYREFMGEDLPPSSPHSWPNSSANGPDLDRAADPNRAENIADCG
jgi:hypothetical protein